MTVTLLGGLGSTPGLPPLPCTTKTANPCYQGAGRILWIPQQVIVSLCFVKKDVGFLDEARCQERLHRFAVRPIQKSPLYPPGLLQDCLRDGVPLATHRATCSIRSTQEHALTGVTPRDPKGIIGAPWGEPCGGPMEPHWIRWATHETAWDATGTHGGPRRSQGEPLGHHGSPRAPMGLQSNPKRSQGPMESSWGRAMWSLGPHGAPWGPQGCPMAPPGLSGAPIKSNTLGRGGC